MELWSLAQIILGFVAIVAVGWALKRFGLLSEDDARPINNIIIYAGLPAMIFQAVHPADLDADLALVAAVAWLVFIVTATGVWFLCRLLGLTPAVAGGFVLAASLGNTGYIGYPVSEAILGSEGLVRAIFYDVFGTGGALLLVGLFIAQRMGRSDGPRVNPVKEALTFPAVIALAAALAMKPVPIPDVVSGGLDAIASLVVPLIMISVGLSLKPGVMRQHAGALAILAGLRLAAAPLVALGFGSLFFADPEIVRLVVLQAGMPSMMLTLVVGARFGLDTDFIASAILVTTLASIVTIPLMQVMAM